jgi:putative FmdB family regulatory protein
MSGVLYDYTCKTCQSLFETRHPMSFPGPVSCPFCGSHDTQKVISVPASVLDWRDSDSVHESTRFRGAVQNKLLSGGTSNG